MLFWRFAKSCNWQLSSSCRWKIGEIMKLSATFFVENIEILRRMGTFSASAAATRNSSSIMKLTNEFSLLLNFQWSSKARWNITEIIFDREKLRIFQVKIFFYHWKTIFNQEHSGTFLESFFFSQYRYSLSLLLPWIKKIFHLTMDFPRPKNSLDRITEVITSSSIHVLSKWMLNWSFYDAKYDTFLLRRDYCCVALWIRKNVMLISSHLLLWLTRCWCLFELRNILHYFPFSIFHIHDFGWNM